jgi:hypothetical protein
MHGRVLTVWKGSLDCVWKLWMLGWGNKMGHGNFFLVISNWECMQFCSLPIDRMRGSINLVHKFSIQEWLEKSFTKAHSTKCNPDPIRGSLDAWSTEHVLFQVFMSFHEQTNRREFGKSIGFQWRVVMNFKRMLVSNMRRLEDFSKRCK